MGPQKYYNKLNPPMAESKHRYMIENLKLLVTLRDNILQIFSYLLHGHENELTEEQYASLRILHDILRKKMVHMHNMLPILPQLENKDKNQQTRIILSSLMESLPSYLSCTAKFLSREIQSRRLNLNVIRHPKKNRLNYLANINQELIAESKIKDIVAKEMREHNSNVTEKILNPVFRKFLYNLRTDEEHLPQEVFGLILINLPNTDDDPVLEENIRYVYETCEKNFIPNWNLIGKFPVSNNVYKLVFSVLSKILDSANTSDVVKNAVFYVYNHLKIPTSIYNNPSFKYMYKLIKKNIDVGLLFSAIVPQEFDADAIRMKNRLLNYFSQSYGNEDLEQVVDSFNKFSYDNPLDLLMAFLTRIVNHIPASKVEILQPATALLSALIVKKHIQTFTPYVSPEVDIMVLLESLKNRDIDSMLPILADSIKFDLISHPRISVLLGTLIPTEKDKCLIPKQCLINTFQQVQRLYAYLPVTLITKIQNVLHILQTSASSQMFSVIPQYSIIADKLTDIYQVDQNKPIIVNGENNAPPKLNKPQQVWEIKTYVTTDSKPQNSTVQKLKKAEIIESAETEEPVVVNPVDWSTPTSQISYSTTQDTITESISEEVSVESKNPYTVKPINKLPNDVSEVPEYPSKTKEGQKYVTDVPPQNFTSSESSEPTEEISEDTTTKRFVQESSPENVSTTIVLPPLIKPNRPLTLHLSDNGVLIVTTDEHQGDVKPGLVLPEIAVLLKPPDAKNPLKEIDTPIVTQVLRPLSVIFGKNYVSKILKNPTLYPTNIALLTALLKKVQNLPQMEKVPELVNLIRKYIYSIEYVSPTILLPIVISLKKLTSNVVYSTFKPHDLTFSIISENPYDGGPPGSVTIPIINPKTWLQSINPSNPYIDLLPSLPKDSVFENKLQALRNILTHKKIVKILGTGFNPLLYPNKGALLITLLHRLQRAQVIQSNHHLKSIIDLYIQAIETPSINTNVAENYLLKMMSETTGHWQPELTSLIYALPPAKNNVEIAMMKTIKMFLGDTELLEKLRIAKPTLIMSRGELLHQIIQKVLSSDMQLEKQVLRAFRYYKDKVMFNDTGALPIIWMWVQVYVVKTEVRLGDMIRNTLNFDKLPYQEKLAYNNLITYLAKNQHLLDNSQDFAIEKYKTQGEFVKAFFKYLLKKLNISDHIKQNIQMLLPYVMLTGPGAVQLPNFFESF